ncbi:hypothetical protein PINS_up012411 [Pythium insidiosum]|nr:hypothetical protein PINS_up012411 [Pythium insidiosum]
MSSKQAVLRLYKCMLRDASQFESYNYRRYAVRRVQEEFRKNKSLPVGSVEAEKAVEVGHANAGMLHRQVIISKLYPPQLKSIMEQRC